MAAPFTTATYTLWGTFADAASLPTTDPRLQAGALAWATLEASLYVYDGAAWQAVSGGTIAGTIALNEVAFGTGVDTIGGSANLTWDNASSVLAVIGDASDCLTVASVIDGPFLAVSPTLYTLAITDPLTPTSSATMGPGDVAVGDGLASGNVQAGLVGVTENATGNRLTLTAPAGLGTLTSEDSATNTPVALNVVCEELQVNGAPGASGEVLTSQGAGAAPIWAPAAGGGAVFAGALTVYVDPVNGTDAPGGGTLGAPYRTINYAYSQVPSLGAPGNVTYNGSVGQFVTEKLIIQLAPGRYVEDVVLGFRRGRVQLVGDGVQIIGSVTMRALRADFPAASMEALKANFPAPYTGAGTLATFEITGSCGGGVEADATADPLVVTGLTTLLFDEPTVPGLIASGTAWDNNYGQFNFYANKANLIGGMVISTSYVTTPFRGLGTSVIEVDGSTIGEASTPVRSYFGAVPYAYVANPTLWNTGTGVATGAQTSTTLQDTSKTWTVNQWVGATVLLTSGTGATQTRTVISNTATALTVAAWTTTPVAGSTVYSLITPSGTATGVQSSTTLQDTSKTWTVNQYAGASITLTGGTGAPQTRTIASNTADTLTVSAAWTTTPVSGSTTYSVAYQVAEGVITLKTHSSTLGASVGPRLTLGELDGCRIYDLDQTMLGTVNNGGVTGTGSSSYIGSVVNQYRQYSGTGIPPSQYQIGSNLGGTRYKFDSTSYTTIAFNRSSTTGVLTARTLNPPTNTGTATAGAATTLTDTSKAWVTNRWAGGTLTLTGGTGSGQSRTISSNTATAITVSPAWTTNPAAGTTYTVTALAAFDFQDDARSLAYTPTTGAQWLDPDPTTVGSALDKMGGLGLLAAAPTNGQIPIGNGTNYTPATLTAGSGITVTNGAGSITIAATGGGTVTSVTASAPLASSGGATPNVSLTGTVGVANGGTGNSASPANGQLLIGNGSGFTLATLTAGAGTTITNTAGGVEVAVNASAPQSIVLDATATGGAATIIGTIYVPAARTLNVSPAFSLAYIGGSLVGDTTTLTLNPAGGGAAVATWTRTGTLGSQTLTSGGTIAAAGWYDLTLQGTAGSGVAFARGLYLA
jgi:hypothetical protein